MKQYFKCPQVIQGPQFIENLVYNKTHIQCICFEYQCFSENVANNMELTGICKTPKVP